MSGLTLTEVLVATAIVAILAGIALPNYEKTLERGRGMTAETVLTTIYHAERIYRLDHGDYYRCETCTKAREHEIEDALGIDIADPHFDYRIAERTPGGQDYRAVATRNGGTRCRGLAMSIRDNSPDADVDTNACLDW